MVEGHRIAAFCQIHDSLLKSDNAGGHRILAKLHFIWLQSYQCLHQDTCFHIRCFARQHIMFCFTDIASLIFSFFFFFFFTTSRCVAMGFCTTINLASSAVRTSTFHLFLIHQGFAVVGRYMLCNRNISAVVVITPEFQQVRDRSFPLLE